MQEQEKLSALSAEVELRMETSLVDVITGVVQMLVFWFSIALILILLFGPNSFGLFKHIKQNSWSFITLVVTLLSLTSMIRVYRQAKITKHIEQSLYEKLDTSEVALRRQGKVLEITNVEYGKGKVRVQSQLVKADPDRNPTSRMK